MTQTPQPSARTRHVGAMRQRGQRRRAPDPAVAGHVIGMKRALRCAETTTATFRRPSLGCVRGRCGRDVEWWGSLRSPPPYDASHESTLRAFSRYEPYEINPFNDFTSNSRLLNVTLSSAGISPAASNSCTLRSNAVFLLARTLPTSSD